MRRFLVISFLGLALGVALWLPSRFDTDRKPLLDRRNPATVELTIFDRDAPKVTTLTNVETLLSLLREGRHVPRHLHTSAGRLTFHYADGGETSVRILPGHTNADYEFTCSNGYYAVSRAAFMSALSDAGVDTNWIPIK